MDDHPYGSANGTIARPSPSRLTTTAGAPSRPTPGTDHPATPGHGAGLWIARQLADVLLTSTNERQTAVRMYFPYDATHWNLDDEAGFSAGHS
jgi:hypothetical protein